MNTANQIDVGAQIDKLGATALGIKAERDALRSDIAALRAASEKQWQPIETAPRSYTPILLFDNGSVGEGWHSSHLTCWEFANSSHVMRRNPSHWMPLPDAAMAKP